jgi:hypothetical protein
MWRSFTVLLLVILNVALTAQDAAPGSTESRDPNHKCLKCHGETYFSYFNESVGREVKERMNPINQTTGASVAQTAIPLIMLPAFRIRMDSGLNLCLYAWIVMEAVIIHQNIILKPLMRNSWPVSIQKSTAISLPAGCAIIHILIISAQEIMKTWPKQSNTTTRFAWAAIPMKADSAFFQTGISLTCSTGTNGSPITWHILKVSDV